MDAMKTSELPEAPASVTYSIMRNGFNMLFTVRGTSGTDLLSAMDTIEKKLTDSGYAAQPARTYGGGPYKKEIEYVEGRVCPKCQNKLVVSQTKVGRVIKCSTNKYDFMTKTSSGCDFVEWPDKVAKDTVAASDPIDAWPDNDASKARSEALTAQLATDPDFYCQIHKVEWITHEKDGRSWQSHQNQDGSYCNKK